MSKMKRAYHEGLDIVFHIEAGCSHEELPGVTLLTGTHYALLYDNKYRATLYLTSGKWKPTRWIPPFSERWYVSSTGEIYSKWDRKEPNLLNAAQAAWAAEHVFVRKD